MPKSTFRVLACEARPALLVLFACFSRNLTPSQHTPLMKLGGAA
ncbi:hypothetical protein SGGMMB4_05898 (plasmid) [Sodalis glossinidius str. 'morsitans']|uniref:Uncharacterized protein n=1 Tax=Sodalis glossinidius (strain morsitans) TaxID=343509 RepID=A0A193QP25_SODGM|nr:hypothetical protein SGGMMB4_05898 [Sodalis glossinidius str. 'morsitans']